MQIRLVHFDLQNTSSLSRILQVEVSISRGGGKSNGSQVEMVKSECPVGRRFLLLFEELGIRKSLSPAKICFIRLMLYNYP